MRRNFAVLNSRIFIARIPRCLFTFRLQAQDEVLEIIIERKSYKEASTFLEFSSSSVSEYHSGIHRRIRAYNWKGISSRFPFPFAPKNWTRYAGSVNEKSWSLRVAFYSSFLLGPHSPESLQYVPRSMTRKFYSDRAAFLS